MSGLEFVRLRQTEKLGQEIRSGLTGIGRTLFFGPLKVNNYFEFSDARSDSFLI